MTTVTIAVAFVAGLVSFLAPCVLPLIPGFLAYLAGTSLEKAKRWETFTTSFFFVLGFSAVFAILGVLLNTVLTNIAYDVQEWLSRIGGVIIIFFGLYLAGLIHLAFLEREHKLHAKKFKSKYLTAFVFGAAFAAGWTPCVGPALGAILGLAATQPGSAFGLLLAYALGLGIPFLILGLFAGQAGGFIRRNIKWIKIINVVFGIILIALGVLIFTQRLSLVANWDFLSQYLLK